MMIGTGQGAAVLQQVVGQVDAAILLVDEAIAPPAARRRDPHRPGTAPAVRSTPFVSDRLHVIVLSLCR
ncbi:MAG: hypothetical protein IPK42_05885 [Betaproteobacteria bacterium]|nr:hypothetical protein [Betaproteobacteria bacterium]